MVENLDTRAEVIREVYNQVIMVAEDFNAWLSEENKKTGLDKDTVQEIIKELLR